MMELQALGHSCSLFLFLPYTYPLASRSLTFHDEVSAMRLSLPLKGIRALQFSGVLPCVSLIPAETTLS